MLGSEERVTSPFKRVTLVRIQLALRGYSLVVKALYTLSSFLPHFNMFRLRKKKKTHHDCEKEFSWTCDKCLRSGMHDCEKEYSYVCNKCDLKKDIN